MNKRYHGKRHATGRFTRWSGTPNRHFFSYLAAMNARTDRWYGLSSDTKFKSFHNYLRELAFKAAHQMKTQCSKAISHVRLAFREEAKLNRMAYLKQLASQYE